MKKINETNLRKLEKRIEKKLPRNKIARRALFILVASLPVIAYVWKFTIANHNGIFQGEDWDEFAQMYQAARITIIHYHQFPWWNPWSAGGEPLFANPQFGLFSIQTPLVLIFGTVAGLHYSLFLYFILGFWGMYALLHHLKSSQRLMNVLLSYIWVFSGFPALHLSGGHFTFAVYLLVPWAILALLNIKKKYGWLWFGLIISLFIQTALHYITFEAIIICIILAAVQITKRWLKSERSVKEIIKILKPYIYASIIILVLCSVRILYTLQFTHEYQKLEAVDPPQSMNLLAADFTFRHPTAAAALSSPAPYGWVEYGDYFGIITLGLLGFLLIKRFSSIKSITLQEWCILVATLIALLYAVGSFSSLSPYEILHNLPIFNQMRVPYRFIGWVAFGVILFLVRLPKKPLIIGLLALSAVDVFSANYSIISYNQPHFNAPKSHGNFQQYAFFDTNPKIGQARIVGLSDFRLLKATEANYGEIYGYEPSFNLEEYYYLPGTTRCGINQGCNFVMTNNARVVSWSPNKIVLDRTGSGKIELDMNPGKVWSVNGQHPFNNERILELTKNFVITNKQKVINIDFGPKL